MLNTFKNVDYLTRDSNHLQKDALGYLVKQLKYFNPEKGKGFTLATLSVKRYFIFLNTTAYKEENRHAPLVYNDEDENELPLSTEPPSLDLHEFFQGFHLWWNTYLPQIFPQERNQKTARAVIDGFRTFDGSLRKEFVNQLKVDTQEPSYFVRKIFTQIKPYIQGLFVSYRDSGTFAVSGMVLTGSFFSSSAALTIPVTPPARQRTNGTPELVEEIRAMHQSGQSIIGISRELNLNYSSVHRWLDDGSKDHRKGALNCNAKMTDEKVTEIRREYAETGGLSIRGLARKYEIKPMTVRSIVKGLTWRHLPHTPLPTKPHNRAKKLSPDIARAIYSRYWAGETPETLAQEFAISRQTIEHIRAAKSWKSATAELRRERQLASVK